MRETRRSEGFARRPLAKVITTTVILGLAGMGMADIAEAQAPDPPDVVTVEINGPPISGSPPVITIDPSSGGILTITQMTGNELGSQCLSTHPQNREYAVCIGEPLPDHLGFEVSSWTEAFPFITGGGEAEAALGWIAEEATVAVSRLYGVPNDYRVLRYGRAEVRDYISGRLQEILDRAAYGHQLAMREQAAIDFLRSEFSSADAIHAVATHGEYQRYTANPCAYAPPTTPEWVESPVAVPEGVRHHCLSQRIGLAAVFSPPMPSAEHFRTWGLYAASGAMGLDVLAQPAMKRISSAMVRAGIMGGALTAAVSVGIASGALVGLSTSTSTAILTLVGMTALKITAESTTVVGLSGASIPAAASVLSAGLFAVLIVSLAAAGLGVWDLVERQQTAASITAEMNAALAGTDPFAIAQQVAANAGRDLDADRETWADEALRPLHRSVGMTAQISDFVARNTAVLPNDVVREDPTDLWDDHETTEDDIRFQVEGQPDLVDSLTVPVGDGVTSTLRFDRHWLIVDDDGPGDEYEPHPALSFGYVDPDGTRVFASQNPSGGFLLNPVANPDEDVELPEPYASNHIEYLDGDEVVRVFLHDPDREPEVGPRPGVAGMFVPGRTHTLRPNPVTPEGAFDPDAFVDDYTYTWTLQRFDTEAGGSGAWVDVALTPDPYGGNPTYGATFVPAETGHYQAVVELEHESGDPQLAAAGRVDFVVEPPAIDLVTVALSDDAANGELDLSVVADQTSPVTDMAMTVQWPGEIGSDVRPEVTYDLTQCSGTACAIDVSRAVGTLTDLRQAVRVTVTNGYGSATSAELPITTPNRPTLAAPPEGANSVAVVDFDPYVTHVQLPVAIPDAPASHALAVVEAGTPLPGDGAGPYPFSLRDPVTGETAPGFDVLQLLVDELGEGVLTASIDDQDDEPIVRLDANLRPEHVGSYEVPIVVTQFGRHVTTILQLDVVAAPDDKFRAGIFSDDVDPDDFGVDDLPVLVPDIVGGKEAWDAYDGELCVRLSSGLTGGELCDDVDAFFDDEGDPLPFPYQALLPHGLDAGRYEADAWLPDGEQTFPEPIRLVFTMGSGPPVIEELDWDDDAQAASLSVLTAWPPGSEGPALASITCRLDGAEVTPCFDLEGGTWAPAEPLAPGSHQLEVVVTNVRGNYATSTLGFTISDPSDTTAPVVVITSAPTGVVGTGDASIGFTVDDETATVEYRLDGGAWAEASSPVELTDLDDGEHTVEIRATDPAGNVGTDDVTWTVDTTAPVVVITSAPTGVVGTGDASISFTVDDETATVEYRLDGGAWAEASSPVELTDLDDGEHTVEIRATDPAGNVGTDDVTWTVDTTVARTSDESWTIAAYTDFLGRAPTDDELASTLARLEGGASRATVARGLSTSDEWLTRIVTGFYQDTLGRAPDPGGLAYWVGQLRSGNRTVAQVAAEFYASSEYYRTIGGGTATTWVTDLYRKLLHREPDPAGLAFWVAQTARRGRGYVATSIYGSAESRRDRVGSLYDALLGRAADPAGLAFWAHRIATTGDLALAVHLATSTEYANRARSRFP